jgi:hypothetical protein
VVDASRSSIAAAVAPSDDSMAPPPSEDTSKFVVIFCAQSRCGYFDHTGDPYCYCCPDQSRVEYCHTTMEDCRAHCGACWPPGPDACRPSKPSISSLPLDLFLSYSVMEGAGCRNDPTAMYACIASLVVLIDQFPWI